MVPPSINSLRRHAWLVAFVSIGWFPATAANFEVHGLPAARAEAVAARAEHLRQGIVALLYGERGTSRWTVRCQVHLHVSAQSFTRAVGGAGGGAKGATTIELVANAVSRRRIDVLDDDPTAMPSALAHEIVHVVLADRFVATPPPRWADEGLAILFDDATKQRGHDADFQTARRMGMIWSTPHLMTMDDYPRESHRQRIFYGQSASLVRWLINRRDAATLLTFLEDAAHSGELAALERHYGFKSFAALEQAWQASPTAVDIAAN